MRRERVLRNVLILGCVFGAVPMALAQPTTDSVNKWFKNVDKNYPNLNKWRTPGKIQTPDQIEAPTKPIQKPGDIKVPSGLKANKATTSGCNHRFTVGSDALFDFDQSTLTAKAEETLKALEPLIQQLGRHPLRVEGHTDSIGSDSYNQELSEKRASRVKNWLLQDHIGAPNAVTTEGFGKSKPVAPNTKPDGSDNPDGRALNRRVEVVVNTCVTLDNTGATATSESTSQAPSSPAATPDASAGPPAPAAKQKPQTTVAPAAKQIPATTVAPAATPNAAIVPAPATTPDAASVLPTAEFAPAGVKPK